MSNRMRFKTVRFVCKDLTGTIPRALGDLKGIKAVYRKILFSPLLSLQLRMRMHCGSTTVFYSFRSVKNRVSLEYSRARYDVSGSNILQFIGGREGTPGALLIIPVLLLSLLLIVWGDSGISAVTNLADICNCVSNYFLIICNSVSKNGLTETVKFMKNIFQYLCFSFLFY